jgi:hypothetical protein
MAMPYMVVGHNSCSRQDGDDICRSRDASDGGILTDFDVIFGLHDVGIQRETADPGQGRCRWKV